MFKLLVLLGMKFNRDAAVPEVGVRNCGALGAAKRARRGACRAQMLHGAAALKGRGSGFSFWMFLFRFGCLKPFLELGLKLEENFS